MILGNGDKVFSGTLTGTILVKHLPEGSAPAQIHATKMDCQAILYISKNCRGTEYGPLHLESPCRTRTSRTGKYDVLGKTGECKGEFTWVWGKGGFKGITGTTPFVAGIYIEEQKEGEIYGSAHWPNLTYTLP